MSFKLTGWFSVNLTSSPGRCERLLNSLSLSKACTVSLHQDELSKMEDEQALVGNATFGELAWDRNVSYLNVVLRVRGRGACVFLTVNIISIVGNVRV